jgi:nitric oxide reductase NorQ protein
VKGFGLEEGVSTRLLVYVGRLMVAGLNPVDACRASISQTLTEEPDVLESINSIIDLYFGDLLEERGSEAAEGTADGNGNDAASQ